MTDDERAFLKRLGFVRSEFNAQRWILARGQGENTELTVWVQREYTPGSVWCLTYWTKDTSRLGRSPPFRSPDLTTLLVWAEVEGILGECR